MDNKEMASKIIDEVGEIDSKYIDEATMENGEFYKRKVVEKVVAFGVMAACVGIVIAGASRFSGVLQKKDATPPAPSKSSSLSPNEEDSNKDKIHISPQYSLAIGSIDMLYDDSDLVVEVTVGEKVEGKTVKYVETTDDGERHEVDQYFESEFLSLEINETYKGDIYYGTIDYENKKVKEGYVVEDHVDQNMKEGETYVMFLIYDETSDSYTLTQDMLGCLKIDGYKVEAGENDYLFKECTHINDLERIFFYFDLGFECQYINMSSKINHACIRVINYNEETRIVRALVLEDAWPAADSVRLGDIVEFSYDDIAEDKWIMSSYPFSQEELEKELFFTNVILREGDYLSIEIDSIESGEGVKKIKVADAKIENSTGEVIEIDNDNGTLVMSSGGVKVTVYYSPDRVQVLNSALDSAIPENVVEVGDNICVNTFVLFYAIDDTGWTYASGIECFKGNIEDTEPVKVDIMESTDFTTEKPIENGIYTTAQDFQKVVEESDIQYMMDVVGQYDQTFFKENDLYYYAKASSRNVKYNVSKYELDTIDGKEVLSVYVDCDYSMAMNTLSSYYFLVSIEKGYSEGIDEVRIVECDVK